MIRRTPTRIELKLEDISEYEQLKREAEAKRAMTHKQNLLGSSPLKDDAGTSTQVAPPQTKTDIMTLHQRIGFNPMPKLS